MDLCIYITIINLLHRTGFPQFILPEIKAKVHFVSLQQHNKVLWVDSLMDYVPSD